MENEIGLELKTRLKFKKIIKSAFVIKCVFILILLSSWFRVSGDFIVDLAVLSFITLSLFECIFITISLYCINRDVNNCLSRFGRSVLIAPRLIGQNP